MKQEYYRDMAREHVIKEMELEFQSLTGVKGSLLQDSSPEGLLSFILDYLSSELKDRAPIVWQMLGVLSTSKRQKAKAKQQKQEPTMNFQLCATVVAMLLKCRHPEMSALAYRNGLILRYSGTGNTVNILW